MKIKKFNELNNVDMEISGIQCDNPKCDFVDDSVSLNNYPEWVDRPCPKCGENLLTQDDYDQTLRMIDAMDIMNSFSKEELEKISAGLSMDEIDQSLDVMNQLKMKKTGTDEHGRDIWDMNIRK